MAAKKKVTKAKGGAQAKTDSPYQKMIEKLGLSQATAAEFLGVSVRTSHGWANGAVIPVAVSLLLRLMLRLELKPKDVK